MKRFSVVLGALASALAIVPTVSADTPPPPRPISESQRFTRVEAPATIDLNGLRVDDDPSRVVAATIVLSTDSVSAARQRAQRTGGRFNRASAERAVVDSQSALRPRLEANGATVRSSVRVVLNALNVRVPMSSLEAISKLPGVAKVHVSRTVTLFNGVSDEYTGVTQAWQDYGYTGAGMKIAIIDDGIDYYHATFGGSGDPGDFLADDGLDLTDGNFPTAKVAGGYDFVGDAYDADIPVPDPDPLACGHHGTHVGGTAAGQGVLSDGSTFTGPYNATTISGNDFLVAPGSAPQATIYAYRVFGCDGSANDDVILDAIEAAVLADVDVINMSLGAPWGTADDPLALALDAATAEGVLSVVSAGNEGPSAFMVGGPSTANTVLSVASVDASSATLPAVAVTGDVTYSGQNSNDHDFGVSGAVSGVLIDVGLGCEAADYAAASGKIAVATRGDCDRIARAQLGDAAGALAVIFVNNASGLPPLEGVIPGADIPFVGVDGDDAALFVDGLSVTLDAGGTIPNPAYTNYSSFTSSGPRDDSYAKPDISAPGSNILSAEVGTGTGAMLLSGTSMAAPHTAGIAVLARQAHPTWSPIAVKGALMSSADPEGVGDFNVVRGGAGMVSAPDAIGAKAYLTTPDGRNSLSFGFRQLSGPLEVSRSIGIVNKSGTPVTYDLSTMLDDLGVDLQVTITPSTITVPGNATRNVLVKLLVNDPENLPFADDNTAGGLASINGLFIATPQVPAAGVGTLKTPMVFVPNGISDIQAVGVGSTLRTAAPITLVEEIKLSNTGIHEGVADTYQWAITDAMDSWDTLTTDVRDVGVQSFPFGPDDLVVFNISSYERVANQATREYDILIDVDYDDVVDFYLIAMDWGLLTTGQPDGVMGAFLLDDTFTILDAWLAFAPANGSVVQAPMLASFIGSTDFAFAVNSWSVVSDLPPDSTSVGYYDIVNPAVSNGDWVEMLPDDLTMLPVDVDLAAAQDQGALGWIVVSVDDTAGGREADRVQLRARRAVRN